MNHREQYIKKEGLDKIIDFNTDNLYIASWDKFINNTKTTPNYQSPDDLIRLHKLVRKRKCFTVLEFGVGYSTIIFADALRKNEEEWKKLSSQPKIRNRFMFQLFSVDASKYWIENTKKMLPKDLINQVRFQYSDIEIGTFNGQLCHYYKNIPNIISDFIYLDAPHPKDVKGDINGLSFQCDERTIMSGDLLLMESTFLPGTFIIVDGRTNNARFLQRNFKRKYKVKENKKGDVTTFELKEKRLGKYNLLGTDFI